MTFYEAAKLAKKSLFKTPDYIEAANLYNEASKRFTLDGRHTNAAEALSLAADAIIKEDLDLNAAVYCKDGAGCYIKGVINGCEGSTPEKVVAMFKRASNYFQRAGKFLDSARALLAATAYCESSQEKQKMIAQATDLFENEKKPC